MSLKHNFILLTETCNAFLIDTLYFGNQNHLILLGSPKKDKKEGGGSKETGI